MEHLLTTVKHDFVLPKKSCIFVVRNRGIAQTQAIPLHFTPKMGEKIQDFVKISRRLVEKSQGFVENIQGYF